MLALVALMLVQAAPSLDPLSQRMVQFCRSKPACVERQRQSVRDFLTILTRQRPAQASVDKCLKRATRKGTTDWTKAAGCLRSEASRRR